MIELINTFLLLLLIVWIYLIQNEKKNDVHFYVARDRNGELYLYLGMPSRSEIEWLNNGDCNIAASEKNFHKYSLCPEDFKALKWEDEPQEVFVTVK